ncbi:uncharacterized protein MONOS_10266c1 [Monocercomonoides exilis]|uniref:uncharacterized protein n=1 Tax=Monocercomonoides exilis TaxID=2049356 RepID=UPI003559FFC9|nr:hypothetical protein MONOS_10266c2 [Monocercomonoides exilis]KAH7819943.1 hypothetical protein MONOS_10266c1 [Monocercomonoides exilis]|eukprot:MONOS_10266.1-p1 / transcript=MONOS_10266.1 / gene=MONOS_10266 / organism=Monocercomonoides_exilis_PA203 / gene_product=unspecified product / transcript_product=unspecified product / location=Mono_scaffold00459:32263-32739(+) / protein_length=144 / sequence_SO=supercontig / SO=protein_coding / is_pseudo=false
MYACGQIILSKASLILPSGLCEKCQEKFAASIGDGSIVVVGPDPSRKGVVAKARSGVSIVSKANNDSRSEKKGVGTNGGGGVCIGYEGGVDATVRSKMNKMEKETKMLIALLNVHIKTICEKKGLFNEVIAKQQMSVAQKKQE